jgi:hypothetical protein
MSSDSSDDVPSVAELDLLSTHDLRERAFAQAEHKHDARFFWDLVTHVRASEDFAADDASAGSIGGGISEIISGVRELMGSHEDPEQEPLMRARYIDYLRTGT